MKRQTLLLSAAALAWTLGAFATTYAQDPIEVGKGIYSLVFENERVRVCDIKFAAGAKIAQHSHPDHFVYVLSGGELKLSKPDGSTVDFKATPGQVSWIPAETHSAVNVGKTEVHAIVVELKETPEEEDEDEPGDEDEAETEETKTKTPEGEAPKAK